MKNRQNNQNRKYPVYYYIDYFLNLDLPGHYRAFGLVLSGT